MATRSELLTVHPAVARKNLHLARYLGNGLIYVLLVAGCTMTLLPFLWMIFGAFKTSTEIIRIPPTFWPQNPTLASFRTVLTDPRLPIVRFYLNSTFVAGSNVLLILFTSSLAGFVFAKYEFFGKNLAFSFILATLMIPFQVLMIPSYLLLVKLHLIDTLWGLVIPSATSAFGIFMMKQFIENLPGELLDAGRIDGASEWNIYWRLVLPQIGPALATLGIITFMGTWNSYLWPLTVLQGHSDQYPIVISLSRLLSYNRGALNTSLVMAGATMAVLPPLVLFAFLQRFFVDSIVSSGVKG